MAKTGLNSLQKTANGNWRINDPEGFITEILQLVPGYAPNTVLVVDAEGKPEFVSLADADATLFEDGEEPEDGEELPPPPADDAQGSEETPDPTSTPEETPEAVDEAPGAPDEGSGDAPTGEISAPAPIEAPIEPEPAPEPEPKSRKSAKK